MKEKAVSAPKKRGRPRKNPPKPPSPTVRVAEALEKLISLYTLHLQTLGITTETAKLRGEILETDEEALAAAERKELLKRELGLPDHYEVGAAIPRWDDATGREIPPNQSSEGAEGAETSPERSSASLFPSYSAAWGTGPEGAESFEE